MVDNKIPTAEVVGVEGEVGLRTGSADNERLVNVALDVGLSKHFALHLEGLHKKPVIIAHLLISIREHAS